MSHRISCLSLVLIVAVALAAVAALPAQAQPTSPCDPEYMDALEARAWMEAQREIAQNQSLINKPDSVLSMTCFEKFLGRVVSNAGYAYPNRIFSETDRWGPVPGFSGRSTDNAVYVVVYTSLQSYLSANFTDEFVDSRIAHSYPLPMFQPVATYTCNNMGQIWHQARCLEFMDEPTDQFFDFSWYERRDPRALHTRFACPVGGNVAIDRMTAFQGFIQGRRTAFNNDQAMFDVSNNPVTDGNLYLEDPVISHLQLILPTAGGGCNQSARVLTGVTVQRSDINGGNPYDEFICTKPGCSADPTNNTCVP